MKRTAAAAIVLVLLLCAQAQAHTLYFTLSEYDDALIEVEGMYSTGTPAAKTTVRLLAKADGRVLWEGRTDEFGTCVYERPDVPYEVELDGGPGHQARQDGM